MRTNSISHRGLLSALRGLELLIEGHACPDPGDVHRRVAGVLARFEEHVKDEEASDLHRWVPRAFPDLAREAARLRAQHAPLALAARAAVELSRRASSVFPDKELFVSLRSVITALRQHEEEDLALARAAVRRAS